MVNINHSTLTDPYLHEPKGVASASAGSIYVANGSGSGTWSHAHHYVGSYVDFDITTPESQSITTTFSALDPTIVAAENNGFSFLSSPNARLVYTEAETMIGTISFSSSIRHAAGAKRNVEFAIYKNGTIINGAHNICTTDNDDWANVTLVGQAELNQNDYIEIWAKASQSITLETASAFLTVAGNFKP